jgi:hypothetical protein
MEARAFWVFHNVTCDVSRASFESAISYVLESHAQDIVRGCLFCVADIPLHMVIAPVSGSDLCCLGRLNSRNWDNFAARSHNISIRGWSHIETRLRIGKGENVVCEREQVRARERLISR